MKKTFSILCATIFLLSSFSAKAEKIIMICKFNDGGEMMPFNIDLTTKKFLWGDLDTGWKVVGKMDRFFTIKSPDSDTTVGGVYMVIDRFSGEFSQTTISINDSNKIVGVAGKGICNTKKF